MVYLREINATDIKAINSLRNNREFIAFLGAPYRFINIETDIRWFDTYQNHRNNNVRCVICEKETDEVIGMAYLLDINWQSRTCEFAIGIGLPQYRGKGIGKKVALDMLRHGFHDLNLNKIKLKVLRNNEVALELYKKIGFQEEGILRQEIFKDNQYYDVIVMSLLKSEFNE